MPAEKGKLMGILIVIAFACIAILFARAWLTDKKIKGLQKQVDSNTDFAFNVKQNLLAHGLFIYKEGSPASDDLNRQQESIKLKRLRQDMERLK